MVNKEELLKERYLLLEDKRNINEAIQCLYYVYGSGSTFKKLEKSKLYIQSINEAIDARVKEIDKILNI